MLIKTPDGSGIELSNAIKTHNDAMKDLVKVFTDAKAAVATTQDAIDKASIWKNIEGLKADRKKQHGQLFAAAVALIDAHGSQPGLDAVMLALNDEAETAAAEVQAMTATVQEFIDRHELQRKLDATDSELVRQLRNRENAVLKLKDDIEFFTERQRALSGSWVVPIAAVDDAKATIQELKR
jgi:hypothetical protein